MSTTVLVGTQKGAIVLRSDERRASWEKSALLMKGWLVTSFARDESGRAYAGVTHDVWGATVMASDDLENWQQLEGAPRYPADAKGNHGHNRIIGAMDPMEQFSPGGPHRSSSRSRSIQEPEAGRRRSCSRSRWRCTPR